MLLSQYVIAGHITGQPVDNVSREKYLLHYRGWECPGGGWGLHRESPPYVFTTVLGYIALRLLGQTPEEDMPRRAIDWLKARGGVLGIPTWGKFWLSMLNLHGWEGINPVLPELWLLPEWTPFHPRRMYSHTRLIYLGLGYLYGRRLTAPVSPIIRALRSELYEEPYETIDFSAHRHEIAGTDVYVPLSNVLKAAYGALCAYEKRRRAGLRRRALDLCFEHILFELRSTGHACISPVNGLLNALAVWDRDPVGDDFRRAWRGLDYWMWEDREGGIRLNGARSHTWDTAFVMQAVLDGPDEAAARMEGPLLRAYDYLDGSQIKEEVPDRLRWHRDRSLGGWCFSDERHRWPVSDCTAEAISAIIAAGKRIEPAGHIPDARLAEAAQFVLSRQNADGGFGSYERNRGTPVLESVNPSEMFGNCMVELSYVECTASCVAGLARFRERFPSVLDREIGRAVKHGVRFILDAQRPDGSWEGFWGINFTYAVMFAIEGLMAAGLPGGHPAIRRGCEWLLARQKPDGGWGEHYTSSMERRYVEHPKSQVIMTAWALMALLRAKHPAGEAIERGIGLLISRQLPDGDFPEESAGGMFFNTAAHDYSLYRNYFPVWALGRYERERRTRSLDDQVASTQSMHTTLTPSSAARAAAWKTAATAS
jgi:lanosterol synthase